MRISSVKIVDRRVRRETDQWLKWEGEFRLKVIKRLENLELKRKKDPVDIDGKPKVENVCDFYTMDCKNQVWRDEMTSKRKRSTKNLGGFTDTVNMVFELGIFWS